MSERLVNHYLVIYDIPNGVADVHPFGTDYHAAVEAYGATEREQRENENVEVVLLGSDSIETLERTHSSYFKLEEKHADQIVARELAELGLR